MNSPKRLLRLFRIVRLWARYTADFWIANAVIARKVLSRNPPIHPGTFTVPTRVESPAEILAISNLISFTPGTLLLNVEAGENLEVHALDATEEVAANISTRLEQPLLKITRNDD